MDMFGQMEQGKGYTALPASPEEQAIVSNAQMKQMLAQALLQQGMAPMNPVQSSGRYIVPITPLQGLAKIGQAAAGAYTMKHAINDPLAQLAAARAKNTGVMSDEMQSLVGGKPNQQQMPGDPNAPVVQPAPPLTSPNPQPDNFGKPLTTWQDTVKNFPQINQPVNPLTGRRIIDPQVQEAVDSGQARVDNVNGVDQYQPTQAPTVTVNAGPDEPTQPTQAPRGPGYMTAGQVLASASKIAKQTGYQLGTILNTPEYGPLYKQAIQNSSPTDLMKEMDAAGYGPGTPQFQQAMLWKGIPPTEIQKLQYALRNTTDPAERQQIMGNIFKQNYVAPENFPAGSMRKDPYTGATTYAPDANAGITLIADPNSPSGVRAVPIPGAVEGQAQKAGAIKAAEQQNTILPGMTVNGKEGVPVWGSDIPRGGQGGNGGNSGAAPAPQGGKFGITPTDKTYKSALGTDAAEYEKNLNSKVDAGYELVRRVNEQEDLLKDFRTGATGPVRERLSAYARDLSAPEGLVKSIGGGDPAAAQEFEKFAAQTNLEQLKQAIGANRMLKTEFDAFQKANPNIGTDPKAVAKVFQWLRQTYANDVSQQSALQDFKKTGQGIDQFPAYYTKQRNDLMNQGKNASGSSMKPEFTQEQIDAEMRRRGLKK